MARREKELSTKGHEGPARATKGLEKAQEGFAQGRPGGVIRHSRERGRPARIRTLFRLQRGQPQHSRGVVELSVKTGKEDRLSALGV